MKDQYHFLDENSIQELSNLKRPLFYNDYHDNLLNLLNKIYYLII